MKHWQKEAIRNRARAALEDLYHNATPVYPDFQNDFEADQFAAWFSDAASMEIDYMQSGGAYQDNPGKPTASHRLTLAERYQRDRKERERARYAAWEWIGRYGKLYTWGRGGRTLAPDGLIRSRGGSSFSIRYDIAEEWSIPALIDLITIVESFNRYVGAWCRSVPEMWKEEKKVTGLNRRIWQYDGKRRVSRQSYV